MKAAILSAALASVASATTADYMSIIAARSGSPIHLQPLAANGESIWIGKSTASYCPKKEVGAKNCPAGTDTNFFLETDSAISMGAIVPGGQQLYIEKSGALGYTQAHSAIVPAGAKQEGWVYTPGSSFGTLGWKARGLLACSTSGDVNTGPWQIYVDLASGHYANKNCLGFDALVTNTTKPDAWQYT